MNTVFISGHAKDLADSLRTSSFIRRQVLHLVVEGGALDIDKYEYICIVVVEIFTNQHHPEDAMSKYFAFALLLCSVSVHAVDDYQKVSPGPSSLMAVSTEFGVRLSCLTSLVELEEDSTSSCTKTEMKVLLMNCSEPSPTTLRCVNRNGRIRITFSSDGRMIWIAKK